MDLLCPRCESRDVDAETRTCRACRICYDDLRSFEPHTRQHTMVRKRWVHWRTVDRGTTAKRRVEALIG